MGYATVFLYMFQSGIPVRHRRLARWRGRLGTAVSLRLDEWVVLVEAFATLLTVQAGLHAIGFPRIVAWASRVRPGAAGAGTRDRVARIAWLVDVASRTTGLRCLPRSLALTRVLTRRGVPATLRIGVRTVDGALLAHAWVESMGRALNDDERSLQQFTAFDRILSKVPSA